MKGSIFLFFILLVVGRVRAEERLQNPIAFSQDGIIYVADDNVSYALSWEGRETLNCQNPRWSADGQTLAFRCRDDDGFAFYIAPSGEVPRLLLHDSPELTFASGRFAVAPDGSALAFFGWSQEESGVYTVSVETGEIRFIATAFNGSIGEAGEFYDPAEIITLGATGSSLYQDQFAIAWGEAGILHTPANDVGLIALSSPEGGEIWGSWDNWRFLFDAEGKYAAGWNSTDDAWVLIDVATGEYSPMDLPENAKPLGWVGDEFFYRTRTDVISVAGNPLMQSGVELFEYNWGFTATTANLNIYLDMPDGEDELVTTLQGYDIAYIEGLAINELFVYYVNSSVPIVMALNEGASADDVRPLRANPEMLLLQVAYKDEQPNAVGRFPFASLDTVQSSAEYVVVSE